MNMSINVVAQNKGFTLLEVMLAVAILAMLVIGFAGAWVYGQDALVSSGNRMRALLLAEEGLDALRNIRDQSYANILVGTHGLSTTSNQWTLTGSSDVNGIFTRSVAVGAVDANRRMATATVTWKQNAVRSGSVSLTTQLTNWLRTGWNLIVRTFVLNFAGTTNFLRVQVLGNYAYVIRDGAGTDLLIFNVATPDAPVLAGQLSTSGTATGLFVLGNYAYISTTANASELVIVNVSNPATPAVVGTFNDAGTADAVAVTVKGSVAYLLLASENEFVSVNVSNPALPALLGATNLTGVPTDITVQSSSAFVSSTDNAAEVQTVSIADPSFPFVSSTLNLTGNQDSLSITSSGTTVVVGRAGNALYVASSSPAGVLTTLGSVAFTGDVNNLDMAPGGSLVFAATSLNSGEFTIFSIATPSAPTVLSQFNNTGGTSGSLRGVSYRASPERAYLVGDADAAEMMIYAPQ